MSALRILSLTPAGKHLGYAFFEGAQLIDWGVRHLGRGRSGYRTAAKRLDLIDGLVQRYEPEVVVLPGVAGGRSGRVRCVRAIQFVVEAGPARVETCATDAVWRCFSTLTGTDRPSQHAVMISVAGLFPELEPLVPQPRRLWESRDYWAPMFDAVARAIGWIYEATQRGGLTLS
jgi:hypothetical protein